MRNNWPEGLIKPFDEEQSKRYAKYLPFWA